MKILNCYLVTVRGGVCFDLYAENVDYDDLICVFTINKLPVAFFDINDIDDISLSCRSKDNNLFSTIYERD